MAVLHPFSVPARLPSFGVPSLVRAAALEAAVATGHLLLYPTGVRPERLGPRAPAGPGAPPPPAPEAAEAPGSATPPDTAAPPPLRLPTEGRARPPVLLLHGFCDNRSAFVLLRRTLLRHGWPYVHALNHSLRTTDLRSAAERLGERVEEVVARTGHQRVDLIGHSLGGLIGRYYVQRLGGDARVGTVITLGTPHSGTRLAPALPAHPVARQMCPGSSLLAELAAPVPGGCRSRFVAFWSSLDALMIPSETARLDHSDLRVRNVHVRGVGHLALPVDCAVSARIRAELSADTTDEGASPDAADSVA